MTVPTTIKILSLIMGLAGMYLLGYLHAKDGAHE